MTSMAMKEWRYNYTFIDNSKDTEVVSNIRTNHQSDDKHHKNQQLTWQNRREAL